MRSCIAGIIAVVFGGSACGPSLSDQEKLSRLLDGLRYVCQVPNEQFRLCEATAERPSRYEKGFAYVHSLPEISESPGVWQGVRKRVLAAGFRITKDVGKRGENVVYPYQGGQAFELEILGRSGRYRIWVLPGRGLATPGSAIKPDSSLLIVQPK